MKTIITFLAIIAVSFGLASCIEDGFSTSPSEQPVFSTDTLHMGVIFTEEPSPTSRFMVYNPHAKSLSISDIRLSGENASRFRVNVDGISGNSFSNVEIRSKDSIYVFVEATLPEVDANEPVAVEAKLDFTTNGVVSSVVLRADGQNVRRLRAETVAADTRFDSAVPYQIFDSLVVAPGATLTLAPGTTLCFHDKAELIVRGTLITEGTAEAPVNMAGDRTGNVVGDISFDIMSRQWGGVYFAPESDGNMLSHTDIRNTWYGVAVEGDGTSTGTALTMLNCRLHNSAGLVLEAVHTSVEASGCEFAEGGAGLVYLHGGRHTFNHCTLANNYLFAAISGPALALGHLGADEKTGLDDGSGLPYLKADITNTIIYGLGADLSHGDLTDTGVRLHRCLFKSEGSDDDNFTECIWDADPLYYTIRSEYLFDYRLVPESPAIGAADPAYAAPADAYGRPRGTSPDLGAYVYTEPEV